MSNEQIKALQDNIANSREIVDQADALQRLKGNRDFQKVVLSGYFKQEAIRLVHLKADPGMQSPEKQAAIIRDIDAIGAFHFYLDLINRNGNRARQDISDAESEIEAIEAGDNE